MSIKISITVFFLSLHFIVLGQQPRYTFKHFVRVNDTARFKAIDPKSDGFMRTYIVSTPEIWDTDDDSTTFIKSGQKALLCFEGQRKNQKREGVFNIYLTDSADHSKRFKIWEQTYFNDRLNGPWKTFTLRGRIVNFQTFKNDSLNGITRNYWIDGKTIVDETEYFGGHNKFIQRFYHDNGKLQAEIPYENGNINGTGRKYYENGVLQEVAEFKDGNFNGLRKYYYPNGQVWIEQIYKDGKSWTVVANYTSKGEKRDPGTLHNGNGIIIFYNEDGTIREKVTYINGEENKSR